MLDLHMHRVHIRGMKLDEYIIANKLTDVEFAGLSGLSQPHVSRLRRGKSFPSRETITKIHDVTSGKVTVADWFPDLQRAG